MGGTSIGRAGRTLSRVLAGAAIMALALGSLAVVARPAAASGTTLYVDFVGNDSGNCQNVNSPCATISYALTQAASGDTILLLDGTLITDHVTIPASFTNLTITSTGGQFGPGEVSANNVGTVFTIDSGASVTIDNLVIAQGQVLGTATGIDNQGTLTLHDDSFQHDAFRAIANSGTLTAFDSAISVERDPSEPCANQVIANDGTLSLWGDTVSGGESDGGAGLYQGSGSAMIENTTFSNNVACISGGAITVVAGAVTLQGDTLAGDTADTPSGAAEIDASIPIDVSNSIIGPGTAGNDCNGTIVDFGFNIASDSSCGLTDGNQVNTDLRPLGAYGGPTETMPPNSASSPEVNQIPSGDTGCGPGLFDQRGVARGQGPNCTIGAVEYAAPRNSGTGFGTPKNTKLTEAAPGAVMGAKDANVGVTGFSASNASRPHHGTVTLHPNGSFTYTPNTGFTGADTFTYTITDNWGFASTNPVTASVNVGFFITNAPQLHDGVVGHAYKQVRLVTTGGKAPVAFKRIGKLPKGLKLSKTGVISGTPSVRGTYTFQVRATDKSKPKLSTIQTFMIKVAAL